MRPIAALAATALLVTPTLAQEAAMPSDAEIAQILGDRIGRDQANVGIAVAVIENGETRFVSSGTLSVEDTTPVTEDTLFEAGSITKVFTNLLLAQLVEEGAIDLDAPVTDYLPEGTVLPAAADQPITAFDLATHSAALSELPGEIMAAGYDNPYSGYDAERLMAWFAQLEPGGPIGESFQYSNAGTALLGQVIETASGRPYAELVTQNILVPLGMERSSLALTGAALPEGMARGHDAGRQMTGNWDFDAFAPAGALLTTAADLAKFIEAASGAVQTPLAPAFETMLARARPVDQGTSIGLGWFVTPTGSGEIVWHNGMTAGYAGFAGFERTSGNGVVVLSNMATGMGVDDIGMHLLDPALPLREQPRRRTAVEIDPAVLPGYQGEYLLSPGVTVTITAEGGQLFAQVSGQDRFEIYPESQTEFFYRVVDAQISFIVEDGRATSLTLHQNGVDQPAALVE